MGEAVPLRCENGSTDVCGGRDATGVLGVTVWTKNRPTWVLLALWQVAGCAVLDEPVAAPPPWRSHVSGEDSGPSLPDIREGDRELPGPNPSNILLLLVDDVGTDRIGSYAEHPNPAPTPNLDSLASEGVLFRNFYVMPSCSPTRAAMLTGRFGRRTGVGSVIFTRSDLFGLPASEVTMAEMLELAPHPWATAIFGKWHLMVSVQENATLAPQIQGFDQASITSDNLASGLLDWGRDKQLGYYRWEQIVDGVPELREGYVTTDTVDDALEAVQSLPEPWFVYVPFHAPHSPWEMPPKELTPSLPDRRLVLPIPLTVNAMVEALDQEIGRLLAGLTPAVRARTTVICLSDNGTSSDAIMEPWNADRGKLTVFDGGVRVPMIITGPHVQEPGREIDEFVHVVDLFPTVAEIAQVSLDVTERPGLQLDGESFLPLLSDPDASWDRDLIYTEVFGPNGPPPYAEKDNRMIRGAQFKLIRTLERDALFEYTDDHHDEGPDLLEAGPLSAEHRAAFDYLSARLDSIVADMESDWQ